MYPGAHSRKDSKPRFPTNKAAVLLLSMILLIGIAVGTTVAFLVARTEPMKSTFEYAKVSCEVTGSKENVQIKNTGNTAAYIRATYVVTWRDAYGKVAVSVPGGYSYTLTENLGNYWNKGADGYFYYSLPVSPGSSTEERPLDRAFGVGDRLTLGGVAHLALAVRRESHYRRSRAVSFGVGNNDRLAAFHHCHAGVSSS